MVGLRGKQSLLLGEVANEGREVRHRPAIDPRHCQLDGESLAACPNGDKLQPPVEDGRGAGHQMSPKAPPVVVAHLWRDDDFCDFEADDLLASPAEHALGGWIELGYLPEFVDDDDRVESRLHYGSISRIGPRGARNALDCYVSHRTPLLRPRVPRNSNH